MDKIKLKQPMKKTIKLLDKSVIMSDKIKGNIVYIKEKSTSSKTDNNSIEYGASKISTTAINVPKDSAKLIQRSSKEIKKIKKANSISKEVVKNSQRIKRQMINLAKTSIKTTKALITITISTIKAIIIGLKALIGAIAGGGAIAITIIIICCLVGLLCGSVYGIFFSNEDIEKNNITINQVIKELNNEMYFKIEGIKEFSIHDECIVNYNQMEWKEILIIYIVKTSNGEMKNEYLSFDNNKAQILKNIYWELNKITYITKQELKNNKNTTVLYIDINSKSMNEISTEYKFNDKQKLLATELLNEKYSNLWKNLIYGVEEGNVNMVDIALSQVGNIGGQPYWSWYGFSSRVEWCAVFVSWVANQVGYIEKGIIPKFSVCETGANWFKTQGKWMDNTYIPKPGDIIFFDWENDGKINHVGIVEKVSSNIIYTIEGNSTNDMCKNNKYKVKDNVISGYGIVNNS